MHYEVVDAKLARTAEARAVLQTAFCSRLLAELHGTEPARPAEHPRGEEDDLAGVSYYSGDRVLSMIQLVIQVCSWSTEKACSQRAESAVMSDQM